MKSSLKHCKYVIMFHFRNPYIAVAGSERVIISQEKELRLKGFDTFILFPIKKNFLKLRIYGWGMIHNSKLIAIYPVNKLVDYFKHLSVENECYGVFVHGTYNICINDLKRITDCYDKTIIYLHDFSSCCRQLNLQRNDKEYCGDATVNYAKCHDCVHFEQAEIIHGQFEEMLREDKEYYVISPSESAARIWMNAYPFFKKNNISVIPHLMIRDKYINKGNENYCSDSPLRIAYVGNSQQIKGWDEWIRLTNELHTKHADSEYEFYHLGNCDYEKSYIKHVDVSIKKDGNNAMIDALKKHKINAVVLFTRCPETYSYVYYECMAANVFIITNEGSGNICDQVKTNQNGIVLKMEYESLYNYFENTSQLRNDIKEFYLSEREVPISYEESKEFLKLLSPILFREMKYESSLADYISSYIASVLYNVKYHNVLDKKNN